MPECILCSSGVAYESQGSAGQGVVVVAAVPGGKISGLVVALHGAGGHEGTSTINLTNGRQGLLHHPGSAVSLFAGPADRLGLVVLAPSSTGTTWAVLHRGADPDTPAVDAALETVFHAFPFDPAAIAVAGFSDGASYALTLGLANGDLLRRVVAFSPGFETADRRQGRPQFFLTHGIQDQVLPISRTSRQLVPSLRRDGYHVTYQEFEGGHAVPTRYKLKAAQWILRGLG